MCGPSLMTMSEQLSQYGFVSVIADIVRGTYNTEWTPEMKEWFYSEKIEQNKDFIEKVKTYDLTRAHEIHLTKDGGYSVTITFHNLYDDEWPFTNDNE